MQTVIRVQFAGDALRYRYPLVVSSTAKTQVYSGAPAQFGMSYIGLAYRDYLAARHLLCGNHLLAGAIMASTAVEKYFKCILSILSEPCRGHLSKTHVDSLSRRDPELLSPSHREFSAFLEHVYLTRYFDSLPDDFSVVVPRLKILAELDELVDRIEQRIAFRGSEDTKMMPRRYQSERDDRSRDLCLSNHVITGEDKTRFVEQRDYVFELRTFANMNAFECLYLTDEVRNDGVFMEQGLVPTGNHGQSFSLRYTPVDPAVFSPT